MQTRSMWPARDTADCRLPAVHDGVGARTERSGRASDGRGRLERFVRDVGGKGLNTLGQIDYYLGFSRLFPNASDFVLMYHSIGEADKYGNVPVERFRRDLAYLTEHYQIVDLPAVLEESNQNRVVLTFDDGYENFYTEALPVIREFGVPVTVFVPSGILTDHQDVIRQRILDRPSRANVTAAASRQPLADGGQMLMNERQLSALVDDSLVTLGNHTSTHPNLNETLTRELPSEIVGAKRELENRFDITIDRFSYPYGQSSAPAEEIVRDSHRMAVTSQHRPVPGSPSSCRVPRLSAHLPEPKFRWDTKDLRWLLSSL